jgi:hypothetical protein
MLPTAIVIRRRIPGLLLLLAACLLPMGKAWAQG